MIEVVDRNGNYEVQKITTSKGKLIRYQTVELPAGKTDAVKVFVTLTDARLAIGKGPNGKPLVAH